MGFLCEKNTGTETRTILAQVPGSEKRLPPPPPVSGVRGKKEQESRRVDIRLGQLGRVLSFLSWKHHQEFMSHIKEQLAACCHTDSFVRSRF